MVHKYICFFYVFVFLVGRSLAIDRSVGFTYRRQNTSIYLLSKGSYATPKNKNSKTRRIEVGPHLSLVSRKKKYYYLPINSFKISTFLAYAPCYYITFWNLNFIGSAYMPSFFGEVNVCRTGRKFSVSSLNTHRRKRSS